MRAVLLVGGLGTRLRPLTLTTPKPMLPVVDRPILEWVLAGLAAGGVDEAVLSLGFRPDVFQDAYPDGTCVGVELTYAVEPEPLDTAGAIRYAARAAGIDERFLVVNGDVLTDLAYANLVAFHDRAGGEGTVALHRVDDPSAFGVVPTDGGGRVLDFVEKPPPGEAPTDLINAGTYVLEPSLLDRIPGDRRVSLERETFPAMVADGVLFAVADEALDAAGGPVYWADTGTPAQYLDVMLDLVAGRRAVAAPPAVAASARVAASASLVDAVVMADVEVGEEARLRRCAVLPGASIGVRAELDDCIVGPGATVGEGARVFGGSVLGAGTVVEAGTTVDGRRVPGVAVMTTWMVTGGAGYIGAHVARRLLESGREVVVLDDLSTGFRSFVPEAARFVERPLDGLMAADLDGIDGVVHLAALKYAGVSVTEPLRFYANNVGGMFTLLEAMVAAGVDRLVYSSSSSVYGTPRDEQVIEGTPIGPESPYGETKLIGEWLAADVGTAHGLRHTSLRYFNVVGSAYPDVYDASPHNLLPLVFRALDAGGHPKVFGTDYPTADGSCVRDYIHVGDLADAHVVAAARLEAGADLGPAYNIGTGAGASVLEVIAAVQRVLGVSIEPEIGPRRPGDPARIVADPTLAAAELGWTAKHDLDDMVRDAWTSWRRRSEASAASE